MEKHFLKNYVGEEPEFKPEPVYNRYGDCIEYLSVNEATYAKRVDGILTLYLSVESNEVVGFRMNNVVGLAI